MLRANKVVCDKRSYSSDKTSHKHDFGQFLFPLSGSLDISTKHHGLHLTPDHCFYLPPSYNHEFRSSVRNEFLILDIPTDFLLWETESMYVPMDEQWTSIRFLLLEEIRNKQNDSAALRDLTRYVANKLKSATPPSVDYIHRHYKESISLETLAAIERYHPTYYSAWFKQKTGKSPKRYIAELRLKEAKKLLGNTSWTITYVSQEIGFENTSSFTRWFVKQEGITPQTYRSMKNG